MKKQVVFITAIFLSTVGFCQNQTEGEQPENKLRFGIKAGVAFANQQYSENSGTYGYKTGGMGGVFVRVPLKSTLYFQPELMMVGKGVKQKRQSYDYPVVMTYLEFPLNLLYKPPNSRRTFFIGGGPAPSFFTGKNVFYFGDRDSKSFDLGINILGGFESPIGFSINVNYTHGLLNVTPYKESIPMIKNRSFGLTIGYVF